MQQLEHPPQTGATTTDRADSSDSVDTVDSLDSLESPGAIRLPEEVTSSEAKLVYLYLSIQGTATVDELGQSLRLPKLSLFSILATLRQNDLVARDGDVVRVN